MAAAVLALAAVAFLTGCTTATSGSATVTKPPLATAAPADGSTLQPAPGATGTPVDTSAYANAAADAVDFTSTDNNTRCSVSGASAAPTATCSIAQKDFVFPSETTTDPSAVTVSGASKGRLASTDVPASEAKALPAGQSITWSTVTCLAIENSIRCTNAATSHGFFVSRIKYELF